MGGNQHRKISPAFSVEGQGLDNIAEFEQLVGDHIDALR